MKLDCCSFVAILAKLILTFHNAPKAWMTLIKADMISTWINVANFF